MKAWWTWRSLPSIVPFLRTKVNGSQTSTIGWLLSVVAAAIVAEVYFRLEIAFTNGRGMPGGVWQRSLSLLLLFFWSDMRRHYRTVHSRSLLRWTIWLYSNDLFELAFDFHVNLNIGKIAFFGCTQIQTFRKTSLSNIFRNEYLYFEFEFSKFKSIRNFEYSKNFESTTTYTVQSVSEQFSWLFACFRQLLF